MHGNISKRISGKICVLDAVKYSNNKQDEENNYITLPTN